MQDITTFEDTQKDVELVLNEEASYFQEEVDAIKDVKIKNATIEILNSTVGPLKIKKSILKHTKKVAKIAYCICKVRGWRGIAFDMITAASLMHDLYKEKSGILHPLMIRLNHKEVLDNIDPGFAEQLCAMIEGHEGFNSIVPKLASKEGQPDQILTDANAIANIEL